MSAVSGTSDEMNVTPFWSALDAEAPTSEREAIEARVRALAEAALQTYGPSGPSEVAFVRYLAERCDRRDVRAYLESVDEFELYLALACEHGATPAVRRFEAEYFREIRVGASRLSCTPEELDEITQRVRRALFELGDDGRAKLVHLTARGDLRALIRLIARRAGLSLRRSGRPPADPVDALDLASVGDSPSLLLVKHEHRDRFRSALADAVAALEPAARTMLRLHEVDGVTLAKLATMYGIDRSTVTRRLARTRREILAHTRRLLTTERELDEREFDSFVDVIRSNLGASIHRLLGASG